MELGQTDIQDALCQLGLPVALRPFFGLGRVQARRVGAQRTADGVDVAPTAFVFPRLCVVAMGWTHALHLCQPVLEARADAVPGLDAANRLVDRRRAPGLRPVAHAEYIDNFVAFSQVPGRAGRVALGVDEELRRSGLRAHPAEASRAQNRWGGCSPPRSRSSRRSLGVCGLCVCHWVMPSRVPP